MDAMCYRMLLLKAYRDASEELKHKVEVSVDGRQLRDPSFYVKFLNQNQNPDEKEAARQLLCHLVIEPQVPVIVFGYCLHRIDQFEQEELDRTVDL